MAQHTFETSPQVYARIAGLICLVCTVALFLSRELALLTVFFNLVPVALEASDKLRHSGALLLFEGADYLTAFVPDQLQALVYLSLGCMDTASTVCALFSN